MEKTYIKRAAAEIIYYNVKANWRRRGDAKKSDDITKLMFWIYDHDALNGNM